MSLRAVRRFAVPAVIAATATVGFAQDAASQPADAQAATPDYLFTLSGDASYAADADFRNADGSFSIFRSGGSLRIDHAFDQQTAVSVDINGEWSHYFFRNLAAVPGDDGSDSLDAYQFGIRPTVSHAFSESLNVFGGFSVSASGMADADVGESLTYGVFAGVNFRVAPKVWIGGGVAMTTQLEDNAFFVPLLTARWDITPDLTLASDGLGARLTYKVDENWSVYARGRYEYRQFRLSDSEIVSGGVLEDQSVPITIGVTYALDKQLSVSAEAGVVAWRRIEFRDSGGDTVGADEADPAAFASVQIKYAF